MEMKVVVPIGMLDAASKGDALDAEELREPLEAALLWLSENPIVPTDAQFQQMDRSCSSEREGWFTHPMTANIIEQWQRRMFIASEPSVPEAIKDLLWWEKDQFHVRGRTFDEAVIEAYRRGKAESTAVRK